MSRYYWIKTELGRHFPNLNFEEGVDFDRNGQIEGLEHTDLDQNGTVDPVELDLFLRANHYVLKNEIGGFFNPFYSQGRAFRPDNPIHNRFLIESELVSPRQISAAYLKVRKILNIVKRRSHLADDPESKLKLVYDAMKEAGIQFRRQRSSVFAENLKDGVFDCEASSLVVLAIARELDWPVYLVRTPSHVFVRWDDGKYKFNMDIVNMENRWDRKSLGNVYSDKCYKKFFNLSPRSIENGIYLSNLGPNKTLAFYLYSRAYAKKDRYNWRGAIADFTEVIKLDPTDSQAYASRGDTRYSFGDVEGAIADFREAIKLDPNDSVAYFGLAMIKKERGDLNGAITDFKLSIMGDPRNFYAYFEIEELVGPEGALAVYTDIIRLVPGVGVYYFCRGDVRRMLGDLEGAIADYTEAINLDPTDYESYYNRGQVKRKLENLKGAIADYAEAIKINSYDNDAYYCRGQARHENGNFEGAIDDYTKAMKLKPGESAAYSGRGASRIKLGRYTQAREDSLKAQEINPDDKMARSNLIKLAFIPDHLSLAIGPRIGSDKLGASLAVGATWPSFHINENLKTGPRLEVGYGPDHSHHSLNLSAGWAFMNKSKDSTASAEVGVGYNFSLADDVSGAPIGDGAFFQYGLRYLHRVTESLGIGASIMVQHELPDPGHFAILPNLELTYHLW